MTEAKENSFLPLMRSFAMIVVAAGGILSLGLTLQTGHNNHSVLLVLLFAVWVLSPFAGLLVAGFLSKRLTVPIRKAIYILMFVITIGSLAGYSGLFSPPGSKPAFIFLVVPLISWILVAIFISVSVFRARKRK
jgi:hypothetical protein